MSTVNATDFALNGVSAPIVSPRNSANWGKGARKTNAMSSRGGSFSGKHATDGTSISPVF